MKPVVILINGMPGTGKSTLAAKLHDDLQLPLMSKDGLKEYFYEVLGVATREESRAVGAACLDMVYALTREYTSQGLSLIIESPMFYRFAKPEFEDILEETDITFVEVHCRTNKDIRRDRMAYRRQHENRHAIHILTETVLSEADPEPSEYEPLGLGTLFEIDTTNFGDDHYAKLLNEIKLTIPQGGTR